MVVQHIFFYESTDMRTLLLAGALRITKKKVIELFGAIPAHFFGGTNAPHTMKVPQMSFLNGVAVYVSKVAKQDELRQSVEENGGTVWSTYTALSSWESWLLPFSTIFQVSDSAAESDVVLAKKKASIKEADACGKVCVSVGWYAWSGGTLVTCFSPYFSG